MAKGYQRGPYGPKGVRGGKRGQKRARRGKTWQRGHDQAIPANENKIRYKVIMFVLLPALFLLPTVRTSKSEELVVFDNFEDGAWVWGPEKNMLDYAVDRKMDLPSSFTICSSVKI